MIWLVVAVAGYPVSLLWFSRGLAKIEREGLEHDERGFPRPKGNDLPMVLLAFGYPLLLAAVFGAALKAADVGKSGEAVFVVAAGLFLVGHWFLLERLGAGVEAAERLEADRRKAKEP